MSPGLRIRRARPDDARIIVGNNRAMARESEGLSLDPARCRRGVRAAIGDRRRGTYWLAERSGRVVGQLLLTFEHSDWRDGTFWWIQSVYVRPGARRQGVLRALLAWVVARARRAPVVCGLRLYVHRDNLRAWRAYRALGLERTAYRVLELDFRPPARAVRSRRPRRPGP